MYVVEDIAILPPARIASVICASSPGRRESMSGTNRPCGASWDLRQNRGLRANGRTLTTDPVYSSRIVSEVWKTCLWNSSSVHADVHDAMVGCVGTGCNSKNTPRVLLNVQERLVPSTNQYRWHSLISFGSATLDY